MSNSNLLICFVLFSRITDFILYNPPVVQVQADPSVIQEQEDPGVYKDQEIKEILLITLDEAENNR